MSKRVKPDAAQAPAALDAEWRQREAVATTLSAGQKAKMRSAEAVAKRHLASLGGAQPTEAMVLEVLTAIGNEADWPKQTRPNVTNSGKPVPGMCLGLVFGLGGGGAKASLISESYPVRPFALVSSDALSPLVSRLVSWLVGWWKQGVGGSF